jgi:hypothetical protein
MYVTSFCEYTKTGGGLSTAWFLHEVDLKTGLDVRTQGQLHAYHAKPTSTTIQQLWATPNCTNCQTWCASSFALPTVANGKVFVPTYALNLDTSGACPDVDHSGHSYQSGIWVAGLKQ